MPLDFSDFYERYEAVAAEADTVFARVKELAPGCVTCAPGCAECCHAPFDLTLIEALYLHDRFKTRLDAATQKRVLALADQTERLHYKLKKKAHQASMKGKDSEEILTEVGRQRIRCPLLNDEGRCDLYEHRPITCRIYGVPTQIGERAHTCGLSGFEKGGRYPTVKLDKILNKLFLLSQELVHSLDTEFTQMSDVLVPVSMALMNSYDEEYLGLKKPKTQEGGDAQQADAGAGK